MDLLGISPQHLKDPTTLANRFNEVVRRITGMLASPSIPAVAVASLPTATAGKIAFASNGRKVGELAGAGTGVLVYADGTAWRVSSTDLTVAA